MIKKFCRYVVFSLLLSVTLLAKDLNKLKVVNWNVLYGFNHRRSVEQGVKWIKAQSPNVVGLQELNGNNSDSLKKIAAKWGHEHSAILKPNGFPVGLTSNEPIEVIERRVKGFHHGYLHCKTYGIHFFVVHFWPGKDHEAKVILEKIKVLHKQNEKVIVMGDFNTNSKKDKAYLASKSGVKKPLYDVVDMFEKAGFEDLVYKHDKKAKYSCPSPIVIPRWAKDLKDVESRQQRIDFIFADNALQNTSVAATIVTSAEVEKISDHYPVIAEFKIGDWDTSIK